MFKKGILLLMILCLFCGCQSTKKEPLTKSCDLQQNDMNILMNVISDDHEHVTRIEAEMFLTENAMVNYGFGDYESAQARLALSNESLDAQEDDGYELELVYDGNFYIMKMNIEFDKLSDEMLARLSIDKEDEVFQWHNFENALRENGGSCE